MGRVTTTIGTTTKMNAATNTFPRLQSANQTFLITKSVVFKGLKKYATGRGNIALVLFLFNVTSDTRP